jgi:erythromycin esterase-like protein
VKPIKSMCSAKLVGLSVVMVSVSLGASGCEILKRFGKQQKHGAIAFDEDKGGWGYSFDQASEAAAEKAATEKCSTCTVRLKWEEGCGALAQAEKDKKVMSAKTGSTRTAAEGAAKASCLSAEAGPCKVVVWACNSK